MNIMEPIALISIANVNHEPLRGLISFSGIWIGTIIVNVILVGPVLEEMKIFVIGHISERRRMSAREQIQAERIHDITSFKYVFYSWCLTKTNYQEKP